MKYAKLSRIWDVGLFLLMIGMNTVGFAIVLMQGVFKWANYQGTIEELFQMLGFGLLVYMLVNIVMWMAYVVTSRSNSPPTYPGAGADEKA